MKKKLGLFVGLLFGLCVFASAGMNHGAVYADETETTETITNPEDSSEPESTLVEETYKCSVVLPTVEHGKISADKLEGHPGDVVTLEVRPSMFYIVESIQVNGQTLVEDEEISGLYKFVLSSGINEISLKLSVNKE